MNDTIDATQLNGEYILEFNFEYIELMPPEHIIKVLTEEFNKSGIEFLRIEDKEPFFNVVMDKEQATVMMLKLSPDKCESIRELIHIIDFEEYYLPTK